MRVKLPDGQVLVIPDNAPSEAVQAAKQKLLQMYPDLDTRGVLYHAKDIAVQGLMGATDVGALLSKGAARMLPFIPSSQAEGLIEKRREGEQRTLEGWQSPESKASWEALSESMEKGAVETLQTVKERPSLILEGLAHSAPAIVGGGAIGAAVKKAVPAISGAAAGGIGEGAITGMLMEDEARQRLGRDLTLEEKGAVAAAATLTGLIGMAGAKLSPVDIDKMLATGKLTSGQASALKRIFFGGVGEGVEETLQSGQERAWMNVIENKPVLQGVPGEAAFGGVLGVAAGTGAGMLSRPEPSAPPKIEGESPAPKAEPQTPKAPIYVQAPESAKVLVDTDEETRQNQELVDRILRGEFVAPEIQGVNAEKLKGLNEAQIRDTGLSEDVIYNKDNFEDPNTSVPRSERKVWAVLSGSEQLAEKVAQRFGDLTDQDFDTTQGPVVMTVGTPSDVRPDFYLRGIMQDVYELAREFDPRGVYVILPEDAQVRGDPRGISGYSFTQNGITYIVPRHLTNITEIGSHWTKKEGNQYSTYAKFDAWSTMGHEFGHGLVNKYFYQGLSPEEVELFKLGLRQNVVDPVMLSKLSPGAQALVQKWLKFRADVMNNRISGREAAARWLSPAKLQKKVTFKGIPGDAWTSTEWTAKNLKEVIDKDDQRFSLEEFIAEQMPKYLYARGDLEKSKMMQEAFAGKFDAKEFMQVVERRIAEFFQPIIELLQRVFNTLQIKGMVDATKEFKDWLEELSIRGREVPTTPAPDIIVHERINWETPSRQQILRSALSSLVRDRKINGNSRKYKRLRQMYIMGEYEEFVSEVEALLGERLKFDLSTQRKVEEAGWLPVWVKGQKTPVLGKKLAEERAKAEWREKKEGSEAFQRWFGNSTVTDADGKPLRVYYARGTDFNINGRTVSAFFSDFLSAPWIANMVRQEPREHRMIGAYLAFAPEKTVTVELDSLTPQGFVQAVRSNMDKELDGVVITSPEVKGKIYIPLNRDSVGFDPEAKLESSHLHFDLTDPEESQAAKHYKFLLDKLQLKNFALSLPRIYRLRNYLLQISQISFMHPEWYWLTYFRQNQIKYYRRAAQLHSKADAAVRQMTSYFFGKENLARMYKLTKEESRSGEHWTTMELVQEERGLRHHVHKPTEKLLQKVREYGLDPNSARGRRFVQAYLAAKNALQYQMDKMQETLINLTIKKYASAPARMEKKVREVIETFQVLNASPFWPQLTFGKWRVKVYEGDMVIYDAGTNSEEEWAKLEQEARAKYKGKKIETYHMPADVAPVLMRLPSEFLEDIVRLLDIPLDSEEFKAIQELMHTTYSGTPIKVFDPKRRVVESNSTDFLRNFSDFALRTSNFLARMEYRRYLGEAVDTAEQMAKTLPAGPERANLTRTAELMRETIRYMLDPQEEMHKARAVISLFYLWGNVKTAALNLWGLANTWLFLNRQLGYAKGGKEFVKAVAGASRTQAIEWFDAAMQLLQGAQTDAFTSITDPNWEIVNGQPTELRQAVEQAKRENVLDQSYAHYLAGQSSNSDLARLASRSVAGQGFKIAVDAGMALFRSTELIIRRASFIAAYRAFQQTHPGLSPKQRYEKAVEIVLNLQADYTKGNRPKLMRGKLQSLIFIFMTWVQNASWATYGGIDIGLRRQEALEGRMSPAWYRSYSFQMVLLMLAVAGLQGLPGMEDLLDVLDMFWKRYVQPGESIRVSLMKVLREWDLDPMKVMHGLSFNLGGVDMSRSIGLGRVVPGVEVLTEHYQSSREWLGSLAVSVAGVAGGYGLWLAETMLRVLNSLEDGDTLTVVGKQLARMPGGIGNLAKAIEWSAIDARGPAGGLLAWENGKARELTSYEIFMKGLGFQPSSVSLRQTMRREQVEAVQYWTGRRKLLLDNYFTAMHITKDREAIADVKAAIKRFNTQAPKELRITWQTLERSMQARLKAQEMEEKLSFPQEMFKPLGREILETYAP